jgi:predicted DNA binding CopG/RHH family protein
MKKTKKNDEMRAEYAFSKAKRGKFYRPLDKGYKITVSKSIPRRFKDENAEREFWSEHDSSKDLNWKNAERVLFPNLKPSTKSISLRLPESLLDALRQMANERDVPYQSLIKMILQERIEREIRSRHLPKGG